MAIRRYSSCLPYFAIGGSTMSSIWIVVADSSRARFFSTDLPGGPLTEIESLSNSEARLHESDLVSDTGGRDKGRDGSSHGVGNANTAKHQAAERFAKEICERLEKERLKNTYYRLHLVCAPAFLGLLRKYQSRSVTEMIGDEVAKDLSLQSPENIRAALPERL